MGDITIHFIFFGLSTSALTSTVVGDVVVTPYAKGTAKIRGIIKNNMYIGDAKIISSPNHKLLQQLQFVINFFLCFERTSWQK